MPDAPLKGRFPGFELAGPVRNMGGMIKLHLMPLIQRSLIVFSVTLTAVTALLLGGLTSALPAVLDLRPALFLTSGLGSLCGLAVWRRAVSRKSRALMGVLVFSLAVTTMATGYDLALAYRTEEVAFANGDVTLRGTLYLPSRRGQHPAVVLLHGAGRSPRHESRFYARMYARKGIAALAYDKRGSGGSSGDLEGATYQALGDDAVQAVELLRRHPEVDPERVGIRGISEGEWTGVLAARKAHPAFVVIVSGAAMSPAEQVAYETADRVRRAGYGETAARTAADLYRRLSAFQRTGEGRDALNRDLSSGKQPTMVRRRVVSGKIRARVCSRAATPLVSRMACPDGLRRAAAHGRTHVSRPAARRRRRSQNGWRGRDRASEAGPRARLKSPLYRNSVSECDAQHHRMAITRAPSAALVRARLPHRSA